MAEKMEHVEQNEQQQLEVVKTEAAPMTWSREEVDSLVATAQRFPRNIANFHTDVSATIEALTPEEAVHINYRAPVGKEKNEKTGEWEERIAEGPSVRLAEIIYSSWGHLIFKQDGYADEKFAYGIARGRDLQSNNAFERKVMKSIMTSPKHGPQKRYSEAAVKNTVMACVSIAFRDVVFRLVPKLHWKKYSDRAYEIAAGNEDQFPGRVEKALTKFENLWGIDRNLMFKRLKVSGQDEITRAHFREIIGMYSAIDQGEATIQDFFPPAPPEGAEIPGAGGAKECMKRAKPEKKDQAPPEPEQPQTQPEPAPPVKFDAEVCDGTNCTNIRRDNGIVVVVEEKKYGTKAWPTSTASQER